MMIHGASLHARDFLSLADELRVLEAERLATLIKLG